MPVINNKEDWWNVLNICHKDICKTISIIYEPFLSVFCRVCQEKDEEAIIKILNEVWWKAPDDPIIFEYPAWDAICDLCSESWVFDENNK